MPGKGEAFSLPFCPAFWWVGLTPARPLPPNPQVVRQTDSHPTHHLLPQCDIAFGRASRARPRHQEVEVGKMKPKGPETKIPGPEYGSREPEVCVCRATSHQLGAAEGNEWPPGQPRPEDGWQSQGFVCPPPGPQGPS